jgi:DNA-binding NarL/FixJ family response regulator
VLRVLVADDQATVRSGLSLLIAGEPDLEVVGEARDGGEAVRLARQLRPDVVLMDIRMPGTDGLEATWMLSGPTVADPIAVVVLTTFPDDEYVDEALRAGAVGFVLKDSDPDRLLDAVRAAGDGAGSLDPAITRTVLARYSSTTVPVPSLPDGRLTQLTARERAVLDGLATGASNGEIAAHLGVEPSTIKTHVAAVLRKLELRDRVGAVIYAYEHGLAPRPSPPHGGDEVRPRG